MSCDIRDSSAVDAMASHFSTNGPIDVLINNAGTLILEQSIHLSVNAIDALLKTNVHGALNYTLAVGRQLIERENSGVVLSSRSTSALFGRPFTLGTAIAKAGVLAMTRSLTIEWARHGVRMLAIAPDAIAAQGFKDGRS